MKHALSDIINLTHHDLKDYAPFNKGKEISRILEIFYSRKLKGHSLKPLLRLDLMHKRFIRRKIEPATSSQMINVLMQYFTTYAREDLRPLAMERGFSKILYEDSENLFIYEGRPDLLAEIDNNLVVVDHKTQHPMFAKPIHMFNNQSMGYCWAIGTPHFMYNYLIFKKTDALRRDVIKFTESQLEQWREDTTAWYFRIKSAIQQKQFLRSWNCTSQYGICQFKDLCSSVSESQRSWLMKRDFEISEKPRKSW